MQVLKIVGYTIAAVLVLALLLGAGAVVSIIGAAVAALSAVATVIAVIAFAIKEIIEGNWK